VKAKITVLFFLLIFSAVSYSQVNKTSSGWIKPSSYVPGELYIEGFEGKVFPPAGWQTRNIEGQAEWTQRMEYSSRGVYVAYMSYEWSDFMIGLDWLITPRYTVFGGDSISFYVSPTADFKHDTLWVLASEEAEIPEDSLALENAFTNVILAIPFDSLKYGWFRYSAPLSKYAGKQIYIGFKYAPSLGSGMFLDNVKLGAPAVNDIAIRGLTIPEGMTKGQHCWPIGYFENTGTAPQTFDVVLEIKPDNYKSRMTFTNVAPDSALQATFNYWIAPNHGPYEAKMYVELPSDEYPRNNTLIEQFNIFDIIEPSVWHTEPVLPARYFAHGGFTYTKKSPDPAQPDTTFIYVIGGFKEQNVLQDSIYRYNTLTGEWSFVRTSPYAAAYNSAIQLNGKVYIPGGAVDMYTTTSSFYIYDIELDSFTVGAELPLPLCQYASGTYGDSLIYIFGGLNNIYYPEYSNKVRIYNTNTNTWSEGTPLPDDLGRSGLAGTILNTSIVLTGSFYPTSGASYNTVYYGEINPDDPYNITWTVGENPGGKKLSYASAGAWFGKDKPYIFFTAPYLINNSYLSAELLAYDVLKKEWLTGDYKPSATSWSSALSSVVRNDSVFMVLTGGKDNGITYAANEWLYIGPNDPLTKDAIDAAAVSIDMADSTVAGSELTPKATFMNKQLTPRTFNVVMEITPGAYKSETTVSALALRAKAQVSFAAWKPETAGAYTVKVYPKLNGDEDASNDTISASVIVTDVIGVDDESDMAPAVYSLSQNYPNPFNPATVIKYSIAEAGKVELKIYNMLGQEIKTLVNEMKSAGRYEVKFNASDLSSGVYVYRIKSGGFVQTKKLMLIK
jgi:hypothetical protein